MLPYTVEKVASENCFFLCVCVFVIKRKNFSRTLLITMLYCFTVFAANQLNLILSFENSKLKRSRSWIEVEKKNYFLIYINISIAFAQMMALHICVDLFFRMWLIIFDALLLLKLLWLSDFGQILLIATKQRYENCRIYCDNEWIYGTIKHDCWRWGRRRSQKLLVMSIVNGKYSGKKSNKQANATRSKDNPKNDFLIRTFSAEMDCLSWLMTFTQSNSNSCSIIKQSKRRQIRISAINVFIKSKA